MNKTSLKLLFVAALIIGSGLTTAYFVSAQASPRPDITFPVAELNNCKSETECRAYCDKPENIEACVAFAQKHGLMSDEEAARAKQFKDVAQIGGPGGCKGQTQCEAYCNDQGHMDECISFAEKHNLMSSDDLAEAKKVNQALRQGARLPGNCKGKQQCETYCKTPAHASECLDFAVKAEFIPPGQIEQARKMLELVQSGDAPQTCLAGKDQCQQYCSEESHRDQCANFMVKAGFLKQEDADVFKKTGGKGPGGCQSKDECEAFCDAKENQQTCFQFGKENGLIPEEKLKQIEEGSHKIRGFINGAPPEVRQCLQSTVGSDVLQEIDSGKFVPNKDTGEQIQEQMKKCFEQFTPKNTQELPNVGTEQECTKQGGNWTGSRCDFGARECTNQGGVWDGKTCNFQSDKSGGAPEGPSAGEHRGPGGCSSAEECQTYCQAHPQECQGFKPAGGGPEYQTQPQLSPPMENVDQSIQECTKHGGNWTGSRCDFGARECTNQGGVWDGSKCNFAPPPTSSLKDRPFLGAILRYLLDLEK